MVVRLDAGGHESRVAQQLVHEVLEHRGVTAHLRNLEELDPAAYVPGAGDLLLTLSFGHQSCGCRVLALVWSNRRIDAPARHDRHVEPAY